jgi:hypothetical protein
MGNYGIPGKAVRQDRPPSLTAAFGIKAPRSGTCSRDSNQMKIEDRILFSVSAAGIPWQSTSFQATIYRDRAVRGRVPCLTNAT